MTEKKDRKDKEKAGAGEAAEEEGKRHSTAREWYVVPVPGNMEAE